MSSNGMAEDKDLQILRLKITNLELAIENMELQRMILIFKIQQIKPEYDRLKMEAELKQKELVNHGDRL